jgi:hypothetical protein
LLARSFPSHVPLGHSRSAIPGSPIPRGPIPGGPIPGGLIPGGPIPGGPIPGGLIPAGLISRPHPNQACLTAPYRWGGARSSCADVLSTQMTFGQLSFRSFSSSF